MIVLGPDQEEVCNGRVGDPVLRAADLVAAVSLPSGPRLHARRVAAVVRLCESEAA